MGIDFEPILKALTEIDYQGYFTLEATLFMEGYTPDNVLDGLIQLRKSVRKLADQFEQL